MPTTREEATNIIEISTKYLPAPQLAVLFNELNEKVGRKTDNDSLKVSLQMMADFTKYVDENIVVKQGNPRRYGYLVAFMVVVLFHIYVVLANIAAMFLLPFWTRWYVSIPLVSLLVQLMFTRVECPLTNIENKLRLKLGFKRISGFVGHYLYKPVRKAISAFKEAAAGD